jgi:hypothetical protein
MIRHGLSLLLVLCLCALAWSESPCELADGSIDASCIAAKPTAADCAAGGCYR